MSATAIFKRFIRSLRQLFTMMNGARSVHLWWNTCNPITEIKADVVVDESVPGTYVCACGFEGGYMGIQELLPDQDLGVPKVAIFSVWDSDRGNCRVVESGPNVTSRRFGGEGTGCQSFLPYDWKIGEVCSCKVQAVHTGSTTTYKGWFKGSSGDWMHIATYEVSAGGRLLQGVYSFVEDFNRTGLSQQQCRRARFALQCQSLQQTPKKIMEASFSADDNPITNIDAAVEGPWLCLATGGNVFQRVPLHCQLQCEESNTSSSNNV